MRKFASAACYLASAVLMASFFPLAAITFVGCNNNREKERHKAVSFSQQERERRQERDREREQETKARKVKEEEIAKTCTTAPTFGTKVNFVKTLDEACQQAEKEKKLVFLFHLSGDFDNNDFT